MQMALSAGAFHEDEEDCGVITFLQLTLNPACLVSACLRSVSLGMATQPCSPEFAIDYQKNIRRLSEV